MLCKRPITNLKRHFCVWGKHTIQMHAILESNHRVIKLPRNGSRKAKKLNKKKQCSL